MMSSSFHNHHRFRRLLLLLLLLLTSCVISTEALITNETRIPGCPSFDCGNGVIIKYPFSVPQTPIQDNSTSDYYCGYQNLTVTCQGNTPTFATLINNYTVTNINQDSKIITLVDAEVESPNCPIVKYPFNISNVPILNYSSNVIDLTFFFNCSDDGELEKYRADCLDSVAGISYVFVDQVPSLNINTALSNDCKGGSVVAPVLWSPLVDNANISELFGTVLMQGFELQWKEALEKNCVACERSNGYCGYENSTEPAQNFTCFCPDGSRHAVDCSSKGEKSTWRKIVIGASSFVGFLIILTCSCYYAWQRHKKSRISKHQRQVLFPGYKKHEILEEEEDSGPLVNKEFQLMDIATIRSATQNFSLENKLGEGGFGPVYKGILPTTSRNRNQNQNQIAIKRLSINSTQGLTEFRNEVKSIAKLQHRNLVRLLGCCKEGNEKLLIYEYLPNGSLDTFLFDSDKRVSILDWNRRKHIILGITRGLVYLHEDSRLKVIHRDLKASNILLDVEMNPKISDFGLARIFNHDENEANTKRVVGTYGYMAPEFAMQGIYSVKSDVYSFGVVMLEIIIGQKNGRSYFSQHQQSLPHHVWEAWKDGKCSEMIDPLILGSCPIDEVTRFIHIGLLCIQENPRDRPTMPKLLSLFQNEQIVLQEAKRPPSFSTAAVAVAVAVADPKNPSINELTISVVDAR